jgi:tRNA 2-selenouridine synthase
VNLPVLDDEGAPLGTLYVGSTSRLAGSGGAGRAKHRGNADGALADKSVTQPLVYRWRGGQRSRALAHVLNEAGARAAGGGYRAYRRHVVGQLETLPLRFRLVVLCGLTGSGRAGLAALAAKGANSTSGNQCAALVAGRISRVAAPQSLETAIAASLGAPTRRVKFLSVRSKRIGKLQLPETFSAAWSDAAHAVTSSRGGGADHDEYGLAWTTRLR